MKTSGNEKKCKNKKIRKLFYLVVERHKNELISWSCFFASFFLLFVAVFVFLMTQESGVLKAASCGNAFRVAVISISLLVVLSFLSLCGGFFFCGKFKKTPRLVKFFIPGWGWYRIFLSAKGAVLAEVEDEEIKKLAREKGIKRIPSSKRELKIPKFMVFQFNKLFVSSDTELNAIIRVKLRIDFINIPYPCLLYDWCGGSLLKFRSNLERRIEKGRFLSNFDNFFDKDVKQNLNGSEIRNLDLINAQRTVEGVIKRVLAILKERIKKTDGINCSIPLDVFRKNKVGINVRFKIVGMQLEGLRFLRQRVID